MPKEDRVCRMLTARRAMDSARAAYLGGFASQSTFNLPPIPNRHTARLESATTPTKQTTAICSNRHFFQAFHGPSAHAPHVPLFPTHHMFNRQSARLEITVTRRKQIPAIRFNRQLFSGLRTQFRSSARHHPHTAAHSASVTSNPLPVAKLNLTSRYKLWVSSEHKFAQLAENKRRPQKLLDTNCFASRYKVSLSHALRSGQEEETPAGMGVPAGVGFRAWVGRLRACQDAGEAAERGQCNETRKRAQYCKNTRRRIAG